jgi:NAD(P)H dehydrogenase (quinone)
MMNPLPRMQMLEGFNDAWIEFEGGMFASRKTGTTLREALEVLIRRES